MSYAEALLLQPGGAKRHKRLVRYLIDCPKVLWRFDFAPVSSTVDAFSDTDFGDCLRTRRSNSGGATRTGTHVIKCWSKTQSTVALSSAKAELTGVCHAAGEGLGLQSHCRDLGFSDELHVHSDAAAATGTCRRRGLGRVRHLAVADLWIQERLRTKDITLRKVPGSENVADMLTKHLETSLRMKHMAAMSLTQVAKETSIAAPPDSTVAACCLSRFHCEP